MSRPLAETILVGLVAGACGALLTFVVLFNVHAFSGVLANYIARNSDAIVAALDAVQADQTSQAQAQQSALVRAHHAEIFADKSAPVMGAANGDVVIVEFLDFRCPYCKSTAPMLERLLRHDRHVKIVVKNLPVLGPDSVYAAYLGFAAARIGRFADFYKTIYARVPPDGDRASIDNAVTSMGLNPAALFKQGQNKDINAALQRNFRLATTLGITGTPALVIGDKLILGAPESADLAAAISAAEHQTTTKPTVGLVPSGQ